MKPFVLEVWEREDFPEVRTPMYRHPQLGYLDTADELEDKRLTPSECAAEYWCSEWRCSSPETTYEIKLESARRVAILHRFATLPHAGDRNYE